jgi:phosphoglycolate phosphatase
MKKLVIFDLDGTLLNTIEDLGEATNHALKMAGFPQHPLSAYPAFVGNGVARLLQRSLPEEDRTPQNVERLKTFFFDYYGSHNTVHTTPYEGIATLLKELTARGVKLAVASNKYHEAAVYLVKHYFGDLPWAAIEGQKDDYPVKPDPSIVFDILSKAPTAKADVLYVGDSGVDMETARRACVTSVGVTWGFRPVEELRRALADHIVDTPERILDLLMVENVG